MTARSLLPTVALGWAWLSFSQTSPPLSPGSPLRGINAAEQELFRRGLEDFTEVETAHDGLGPAFNGNSCAVCHSVPVIGGISSISNKPSPGAWRSC